MPTGVASGVKSISLLIIITIAKLLAFIEATRKERCRSSAYEEIEAARSIRGKRYYIMQGDPNYYSLTHPVK